MPSIPSIAALEGELSNSSSSPQHFYILIIILKHYLRLILKLYMLSSPVYYVVYKVLKRMAEEISFWDLSRPSWAI